MNGNGAFDCGLRGRLGRRHAGLLQHRASSSSLGHRHRRATSTSAPAARRRGSRPARSTATAPRARRSPGASTDGSRVFFSTDEPLVADRHRHLQRRLRALRRRDDPDLGRPDQRQRRLRARSSRAPRPTARGSSSAPRSRSSPPTPNRARTSTSAPAGRRRSSRPARSTATAPSRAAFRGASADGSRVFFTTAEPLVAADTDTRMTSTSAPAGRRPGSRRARSTATAPSTPLRRRLDRRHTGLLRRPSSRSSPPTPIPARTSTSAPAAARD